MGAQIPTEKYGVGSPFHAGGGGGGGTPTQLFEGASSAAPQPHSVAFATPGDTAVTEANGARTAAATIVRKYVMPRTWRPPRLIPDLGLSHILRRAANGLQRN